jgi:sulfur-carrier protein
MTVEQKPAGVTVRYWAAARAAAGVDAQTLELARPATVGSVLDAAVAVHPALDRVARVATFLLDGRSVGRDAAVEDGASLEVLPPWAGR